jgi:hypothetical protein
MRNAKSFYESLVALVERTKRRGGLIGDPSLLASWCVSDTQQARGGKHGALALGISTPVNGTFT